MFQKATRWCLPSLVLAFLLPLPLTTLHAQAVTGFVRDSATQSGIAGARIIAIGSTGDTVALVVTDSNGAFSIAIATSDDYIFSVARIGYEPHTSPPAKLTQANQSTLAFNLKRLAAMLDPVVVEAAASASLEQIQFLQERGFFYRSRATTGGVFLDPAAIEERREFVHVADDFLFGKTHITHPRRGRGYNITCGRPKLYVDGKLFIGDDLDQALPKEDILAMEILDGIRNKDPMYPGCAILVWTFEGAERLRRK